jgi:hypothetical protein
MPDSHVNPSAHVSDVVHRPFGADSAGQYSSVSEPNFYRSFIFYRFFCCCKYLKIQSEDEKISESISIQKKPA